MRILNYNGQLKQLPKTLPGIENTHAYSNTELEQRGFQVYDYEAPSLSVLQEKGGLTILDGIATHQKVDREIDINELATEKTLQFDAFAEQCQDIFRKKKDYYQFRDLELPETYETLRQQWIQNLQTITDEIAGFVAAEDIEGLISYSTENDNATSFLESIQEI